MWILEGITNVQFISRSGSSRYLLLCNKHPQNSVAQNNTMLLYLRILWVGSLSRAQLGDYSAPHCEDGAPLVTFSWWLAWSGGLTHLQTRSGTNTSSYTRCLDGAGQWDVVGEGEVPCVCGFRAFPYGLSSRVFELPTWPLWAPSANGTTYQKNCKREWIWGRGGEFWT